MDNIKFKYMTFDELYISLDRLSRFKLPEESYYRVFSSIVTKCLIFPKYSKTDIEKMPADVLSQIVAHIWNKSVEKIYGKKLIKSKINLLKYLVEQSFCNFDVRTKVLIKTDLSISEILSSVDYDSAPKNIKFLINALNFNSKEELDGFSKKSECLFPVRKLLIVEGITEEILLPVFASKLNYSFEKNGVFILGAGGKSKSPSLYLKLKDKVKVSIILLFDRDAEEISDLLSKNLLKKDATILIKNGEFEDILSLNLIKRSLNNEYDTISPIIKEELKINQRMCENLELYYRTRQLGEFKKAKLAKIIANNIKYDTDITDEVKDIINFIANL